MMSIREILKSVSDGIKRLGKKVLVVSMIIGISIITVIASKNNLDNIVIPAFTTSIRPVKSMVFVRRTNNIEFVSCIPGSQDTGDPTSSCDIFREPVIQEAAVDVLNEQLRFSITGSASLVGHDIQRDMSYIITAYHVCNDFERRYIALQIPGPTGDHTLIFLYEPRIELTDFYGHQFHAAEIRTDPGNDLCLLASTGMMKEIDPIRIAMVPPNPGDRIYNVASPHGLSQPGAVLSYEGYHAGVIGPTTTIKDPHYLNAIATAPGSSGSPILNASGELISVISYGYIQRPSGPVPPHDLWPNASAGPSLEAIWRLTAVRVIQ
jgi:S1-C subfamily serine protease